MKDTTQASRNTSTAPVDEVLPLTQMFLYGLQHVLVMYAGSVAVPLLVGSAVGLPREHIILLISADLFICGAATIIQSIGIRQWLGCRLPLIQGCTFAALVPMMLIGKQYGLSGISGAVIVSGVFIICCAPWISKMLRFFPKVVMGGIVTLIGLSIMPVAGGWIGGGSSDMQGFGELFSLLMAVITLAIILTIYTFASGVVKNTSVLIGLIIGTVLWGCFRPLDFNLVHASPWFHLPQAFPFATPEFHIVPIAVLSMVMVVVMVETMSTMMAIGDMVGKTVDTKMLRNGLNTCGLGTLICGLFNLFPYASFAQNVGLIGLTGVRSRFVVTASGIILMLMGILAKMAALVVLIPKPVLGGAGIVMFGMVAVSGVRTLGQVNYRNNNNGMVVALTLGIGLMPVVVPNLFNQFPPMMQLFLHSGITIGTLTAIVANLMLNGRVPFKASEALTPDPLPPTAAARSMAVRTVRMWLLLRKVNKEQSQQD
ncbi:nucleobase:cation symporter-2 family protein [Aeromonas sp. MdU4]|uniref:nucleobase:cation symporter-2 family protein n=1 Tax=Aeromonas sp. MdU4 TaxID=3342819 RepID=UPI0035BA7228